jgi:phosphotriesterase-related protein
MPNWKMTHLFENIFPQLKALGMTDADLDVIISDNPRRYFEQASKH